MEPRSVRAMLLLPLVLAVTACAHTRAATPGPRSDIAAELMAADRAFAAAAAERGLDGWMSVMSPDAVRMGRMQNPVRGIEAIRGSDAAIFADPAVRLTWDPTDAGAFDERTEEALRKVAGVTPQPYLRPPFGDYDGRVLAVLLWPFLPGTASKIYAQLGLEGAPDKLAAAEWGGLKQGHTIGTPAPLFPRKET